MVGSFAAGVAGGTTALPLEYDGVLWPTIMDEAMLPVAAEKPAGGPDSLKLCEARRKRPLSEDDAAGRLTVVVEDLRRDCVERWKPGSSVMEGKGSARSSLEVAMAMVRG